MLSAEGCRRRRERLWERLDPRPEGDHLRLADPLHLTYLAGFHVDPISLAAGFGGVLLLRGDGAAKLIYDNRMAGWGATAHVEERVVVPWYDGDSSARCPRRLAPLHGADDSQAALRIHDRPEDPYGPTIISTVAAMRRQKDDDELELLGRSMRAGEAGQAWARANVRPGMTELDAYAGVLGACTRTAGRPVVVYGDFAVSPGPQRHGGPPTDRILEPGDLLILDFSVVIGGYRGDFTNTLAVGGEPRPDQQRLFDLCLQALQAGERQLHAGQHCRTVYDAVHDVFDHAGVAEHFPHHAGHGLGLAHPEAPYFVRKADEKLLANDVVTVEPGLYVPGVGGVRIEHNYRVTLGGAERLTHHALALV
jgi:Xaa-Pro aminopeptidase